MPVHTVHVDETRPQAAQLAGELERIELREDIVSVIACQGGWVVATRRRPGRPRAAEKRVTVPQETR